VFSTINSGHYYYFTNSLVRTKATVSTIRNCSTYCGTIFSL